MRRLYAFTLVELLVVIGIIALLISILLPALNKARESALRVQCLSNMHQTFIAMNAYAAENHGWYPASTHDEQVARDITRTEVLPMLAPSGVALSPNSAANMARYGVWGSPYAAMQREDNWNATQIFAPNLARYLGGQREVNGNHYLVTACPGTLRDSPKYPQYPANHSFYYGMPMRGGKVAPRQGRVKDSNLDAAETGGMIVPADYQPMRFLFLCGGLTGSDNVGGVRRYWGFINKWGQFGNVHTTPQGKYMNVMTIDGSTGIVREKPGYAARMD